jgi:hypothetical protein
VEVFSQNLVMPVFALAEKLPPAMFVISAKCVESRARARSGDHGVSCSGAGILTGRQ